PAPPPRPPASSPRRSNPADFSQPDRLEDRRALPAAEPQRGGSEFRGVADPAWPRRSFRPSLLPQPQLGDASLCALQVHSPHPFRASFTRIPSFYSRLPLQPSPTQPV